MHLMKALAALLMLGIQLVSCKNQFADTNVNENVVNDKKVEELLLKNHIQDDVRIFIEKFHKQNLKLDITLEESIAIAGKIRNRDMLEKRVLLDSLRKLIELADLFKKKMMKCKQANSKTVDSFLQNDLLNDVKKRLLLLHDNFKCENNDSAAPKDGKKKNFESASGFLKGLNWEMVEGFKKKLMQNPKAIIDDIGRIAADSGFLSKDTIPIITMMATEMMQNPTAIEYGVSFLNQVEAFMSSDSGVRMVGLLPALLTADPQGAVDLFAKEADFNKDALFSLLQNGDMANEFLKSVAKMMITTFQWAKEMLDDNLKFAIMNGVLISNEFPPINKKKLLKSSTAIIEKGIKLFIAADFDMNLYKEVRKITDEFEKSYFKFDDFHKLSEAELVNMLSQFMTNNILEQLKNAWLTNHHVSMKNKECAEIALCKYNELYRESNVMVKTMSRGMSVMMAYSWNSLMPELNYDHLYSAIFEGAEGRKCSEVYANAPKNCDVLTARQQGMNLKYDHNEL